MVTSRGGKIYEAGWTVRDIAIYAFIFPNSFFIKADLLPTYWIRVSLISD